MPPLAKQIAVVTGASRGIGAVIAQRLARLGAHVILTGRNQTKLDEVAGKIASAGGQAEAIACDLRDPSQIERLAKAVLKQHGRCDILVNNAGLGWFGGPLHTMEPSEWDRILETNLRAPYLLIRAFAPAMITAGRGHIINISSLAGKNPVANGAAYAASKWGLNGLMYSVAEELRPHKIRVSLVAPGTTRSEFGNSLSAEKSPLGALAATDVAHVVEMLVTQADASFVSEVLIRPTLKS